MRSTIYDAANIPNALHSEAVRTKTSSRVPAARGKHYRDVIELYVVEVTSNATSFSLPPRQQSRKSQEATLESIATA